MSVLSGLTDRAVYGVVRSALACGTVLPPDVTVGLVARAARLFAGAPFNRKRLSRAESHLRQAFPHLDSKAIRAFAIGAYEHLFMLGIEMGYTQRLISAEGWADRARLTEVGAALEKLLGPGPDGLTTGASRPCILVTGHIGNWELAGFFMALLGFRVHALYRPLDSALLDRWVRDARQRRGLMLLDKFKAARTLPGIFERGETAAFVADQNAGDRGLFVPFFGRLASTYKAIGLMAVAHQAPVIVGWAQRVGTRNPSGASHGSTPDPRALRFEMHIEDAFGPEAWKDQPDPVFYITARYRRALEKAMIKSPEQCLWMHRFWKSRPKHEHDGPGGKFPEALERKLKGLPWMTEEELGRIIERSDRDRIEGPEKRR